MPLPKDYTPGEITEEYRYWHCPGTVDCGVRQKYPLTAPAPERPPIQHRNFEGCNSRLERSIQAQEDDADETEAEVQDLQCRVKGEKFSLVEEFKRCLLYTSPSPRDS